MYDKPNKEQMKRKIKAIGIFLKKILHWKLQKENSQYL